MVGHLRALDMDRARVKLLKVRAGNTNLLEQILGIWKRGRRARSAATAGGL
jgi:hypothetical protein